MKITPDLPLFGARDKWVEAGRRLCEMPARDDDARIQQEQAAALWQIAFELDRIAAVLEEAHK